MARIRTHPGEVLAEEYLKPLGLGADALGEAIGVPGARIGDLVRRRGDMSADMALRLGRYFEVDPRFWLNLQAEYDLSRAEAEYDYSGIPRRASAA